MLFQKLFNSSDYRKRENDKIMIKNMIDNYYSKYKEEIKTNFEFPMYGLDNYKKEIYDNYLNDYMLQRTEQFIRHLTSYNIDLGLYKTVKEIRGEYFPYDKLVLFTEFMIDTTNLQLELTKILQKY
jgi:hypothetical protein